MFNNQQNNIIICLLLGDGHLSKKGRAKNVSLIVKRSDNDKLYSQYHVNLFGEYITDSRLRLRSNLDKRTNKYYNYCEFSLKANQELTNYYNLWYLNKFKVVPRNLSLNSEIIATWFCDDGWITVSNNNYFNIGLATNGFLKDDVLFLKKLLSERYSEYIGVYNNALYLSDYVARKMINDMNNSFPQGMNRKMKWKDIVFNKPYYSILKSSQDRKLKIKNFINLHTEFSLIELAKHLNWFFTRSNGRKEWSTQNLKRYLKGYIDNGSIIEIPKQTSKKGIFYKK